MIVRTSTRSVHAWRRIRFALLVLAALFVVHDAVYLVHFGPGEGMATAMANHGHHAYWEPFTYLAVLAAGVLAFAAITHFVLLELRLSAEGNDRKAGAATHQRLICARAAWPVVPALPTGRVGLPVAGERRGGSSRR